MRRVFADESPPAFLLSWSAGPRSVGFGWECPGYLSATVPLSCTVSEAAGSALV